MHSLFPDIRPYATHELNVDSIHTLYLEECGKPDGLPVLVVHGGPGVGASKQARNFFDPDQYRIIVYDQRGAGRSRPSGCTDNNTTTDLIEDIESIRNYLDIPKWLLFGGSWGTTLALLYGQAYPDKVMGFILRGVFLARDKDMNWLYKEGASRIFPEHWQKFRDHCGDLNGAELVDFYYHTLRSNNELARMSAAKHWARWEAQCATLKPSPKMLESLAEPKTALPFALISTHFMKNRCFIEENQILENMNRIEHLPAILVHGRYDMVCPVDQALALFDDWNEAELDMVREAGHSQFEPGIVDALVKATTAMAKRFGKPDNQA